MGVESSISTRDIGPEKTKKSQNSSENERMNRDTINVVTTKISTALGTKFDQKDIPFDISTFKKNLNQSVEKVFSNPDIPDIAKEKFKQDILAKIDLLAQVTLGDIDILRTRRNIESVGMEAIEIKQKFGNDEAKIKAHYLGMILSETIGKYIQPTADGLLAAFSDKKESKGKSEYHGKTLETFSGSIQNLDTKYGLNMSAEIEKITNDFKRNTKGDISQEDLYRQMGIKIVDALNAIKRIPDANRVKQFIMNGNLTERSKGGKLTEAQVPNGPKDIVDIVMEYKEAINTFQGTEREVRDARSTALSDSVGSKMKNAVGMEGLKSEFDHLKSTEIEQKMKNASLADFVIMGTQLAQITPILGDIGGGTLDIGSAITGISSDGAKLSKVERAFSGIFGTLGLTVFLGWISRASKTGKMAGIISGLRLGAKYLPDKIGEFLKSGGKLSEQTKAALSSFGKMMGQEFGSKIDEILYNYTGKTGMRMGIIEDGTKTIKVGKEGVGLDNNIAEIGKMVLKCGSYEIDDLLRKYPNSQKKIYQILSDIKNTDLWPRQPKEFLQAALDERNSYKYEQLKDTYRALHRLDRNGYFLRKDYFSIFSNSGAFFHDDHLSKTFLQNIRWMDQISPSSIVLKFIKEDIFMKITPEQFASLNGEKLQVLLKAIDSMASKEIFLLSVNWNYEKIDRILKSKHSIYSIIETIDNQLRVFGQRSIRGHIYVDYIIDELHNFKIFDNSLKGNPLYRSLINPTSDIPTLVKVHAEKWHLDASKFDVESLKDALQSDPEMTLLNFGFFSRETKMKRSQFPDWQSFMVAEVKNRSLETKKNLMNEILRTSKIDEFQIEKAVEEIRDSQTISVNIKNDGIIGFLDSGELKSTWEFNREKGVGVNAGSLYPQIRDRAESIYGIATRFDEKHMEHPISGTLVTEKSLRSQDIIGGAGHVGIYGKNYIKLKKDNLANRAVFTMGDALSPISFGESRSNLSYAQIDHDTAAYAKYLQMEHGVHFGDKSSVNNYIEAQVLDSIKINDVDGIYIHEENFYNELKRKYPQYSNMIYLI